jgi:uncharacterized membrane protein
MTGNTLHDPSPAPTPRAAIDCSLKMSRMRTGIEAAEASYITRRFNMATIRQSIDIQIPAPALYNQLTRFEEYPRFIQDLQTVEQLDNTRLHWTAGAAGREVEWESVITSRIPERRIAWENSIVPSTSGAFDLQALGPETSRVTLTLILEPEQASDSPGGFSEEDMAQRLEQDLARLKKFVESEFPEQGAAARTTQSETSLSQAADDEIADQRFPVAEEVNFDQQSDAARNAGHLPPELNVGGPGTANPAEAMADTMKPEQPDEHDESDQPNDQAKLKQSIERAVPPAV